MIFFLATLQSLRAWVYDQQGVYEKAIQCYANALEIYKNALGNDHPDVASLYNNLGLTYSSKGEYQKAIEEYNKALAIFEAKLGSDHPRIATTYNNMGAVLVEMGKVDEADRYIKKAIDIDKKQLGESHPNLVKGYTNYGALMLYKKNYGTAMQHFMWSLRLRHKFTEDGYKLESVNAYDGTAFISLMNGDLKNSQSLYQKSLLIKIDQKKKEKLPEEQEQEVLMNSQLIAEISKAKCLGEKDQIL